MGNVSTRLAGGRARRSSIAACLIGIITLVIAAGVVAAPAQAATLQDDVHTLTNLQRSNVGLQPLQRDATLDAAAQEWANEMSRMGTMVHSSNDWRAARIPSGWTTNGENIAYGHASASSVMTAWMDSAGHRANILRTSFTRMGVGYVSTGRFWVQIFAGYPTDVLTQFSSTPAPTVSGTTREGSALTASVPAWAPAATETTLQWFANGVALPGATSTTYTLRSVDVGARIAVVATGTRSGYYSRSVSSAPTMEIATTRSVTRVTGSDRFETSVEISKSLFTDTRPSTVYVATGLNYPDSLAAAPVASRVGSPLLLVAQDHIPATVAQELRRLHPDRIVVIGGTPSIADSVERELAAFAPEVKRITGLDRFGTSRALARDSFANGAPTVYLVTGLNFPDALIAAAPAALDQAPVIMVNGNASTLDAQTADLLRDLGTDRVIVVGGLPSVSAGIESGLRSVVGSVIRLTGTNRYGTSVAITRDSFSSAGTAYLATGENFPDALAGAVLAADATSPLMLAPGSCIPRETIRQLDAMGTRSVALFGDEPSLSSAAAKLAACAW